MGQFMSAGERTCNTATRTRAIFPGGTPQININRLQSGSRNSYEDDAAPFDTDKCWRRCHSDGLRLLRP